MVVNIVNDPVPLAADADGTIRIGGTRVTLDCLLAAYKQGSAAETIVEQFPTLELADVYAAIAYYLRHQVELDDYLARREQEALEIKKECEARWPSDELRARLEARKHAGS